MIRRLVLVLALAALASAPLHAGATTAPAPHATAPAAAAVGGPARLKNVTLHVLNRVFPTFHDKVVAVPNKEFRVGDTEYTARIIEFVPDFTWSLKTRKVTTRSGEPRNPAFHIVVTRNGAPTDTSWAFFNMPPHYGPREVLAFVATRIEFTNRPVLASTDSLALKLEKHEGESH